MTTPANFSVGMRATALALAISVTGCSFAFVSGPPANHRQLPAFSCTESHVAPVLDTLWTLLWTANLIISTTLSLQHKPNAPGAVIPLYAVFAGLGGAGMYYGYTRTSECHHALQPMPPAPGTWLLPGAPVAPRPAADPAVP